MTGSDKLSIIKDKSINSGLRDLLFFRPDLLIAEEEYAMKENVRYDHKGETYNISDPTKVY